MATADLPSMARGASLRRLPRPARLTLTGLGLAAVAILTACVAWSWPVLSGGWGEVWQPVALTAALILAGGFETRLPLGRHHHTVSPAEAALAAGLFWLPPAVVVLAAALGVVVSQQLAGGTALKRLVNAAQYTVATGAAAAVAGLGMVGAPGAHFPRATLSRLPGLVPTVTTRWCVVTLLAMAVFFAVNHTLVALITSLTGGPGLAETWRRAIPPGLAHWAANTANGLLGAVLAVREPMLVPIVGGSVALTALSSRAWASSLALRERSRLLADAGQAATALRNEDLYRAAESERAALQDIVGHSTDGIYTVSPDRTVRSWNPAMAAITGWSAEEAVGRKCYDLLRARDAKGNYMCASACPIQAVAGSSSEVVRDASILTRDRDTRWINYAHAPIVDHRTGRMETDVVVVRDVTRERRTEEAKADFVANISHELRSPLTPIKGFLLTLLREDRWFAEERRRDYYRLMLGQTERLEALIENLLDVTRVETGVGVLHATSVDAKRVVEQAVARCSEGDPGQPADAGADPAGRRRGTAARRVVVRVPDGPVTVRANLRRAEQVLGHLLSNAFRYSPEGSPVEVELRIQDDEVVFDVRDAGPGIPADEQTRIFERFHRGGYYMTREPGGAGLGLYLAKRLVEAMGGRIWVDSTLGHGSTFSFALRAVPVAALDALRKHHRCAG